MKVVFLEEVYCLGVDQLDGEMIEYRLGHGFWANQQKLERSKRMIQKSLGKGWRLEETEYEINVGPRQKYLFVLNHEYSLLDGTCFFYSFPPRTTKEECLSQRAELEKNPKYSKTKERIYDSRTGGWFIERYQIIR